MNLDSLPNEILLHIIDSSAEPNIFLIWLTLYKRSYQLCLDHGLIERMKVRFIRTIFIPKLRTTEDGLNKLDIIRMYPNRNIISSKKYRQRSGQANPFECTLYKETNFQDNGSYSFIKYDPHRSYLIGRIIEVEDNKHNEEGKMLTFILQNSQSITSKYDFIKEGEGSSVILNIFGYRDERYVFKDDKLMKYSRNELTIDFNYTDGYVNMVYDHDLQHIKVVNGVVIKIVSYNPLHGSFTYNHHNNGKGNINLGKKEGEVQKRRKSRKKHAANWFKTWITNLPLLINNEGKIVRKPVKLPKITSRYG